MTQQFIDNVTGQGTEAPAAANIINENFSELYARPVGGSVTSVGLASTDLTIANSPITGAGTITANLNPQSITPGSYTNTNLTVNAKGIITAVANGSGGGGGSGTVTSVGLTSSNLTVTGTSPITSSGTFDVEVPANGISNSLLAQAVAYTLKGNASGSTGNVADLSVATVQALLGITIIEPSGDTSGATDYANIQAALTLGANSNNGLYRLIQLDTGHFYINQALQIVFPIDTNQLNTNAYEFRGQGETVIEQVTDGTSIIQVIVTAGGSGSPQGLTIANMQLQYTNAQSAVTYPGLTAIGFKSSINPALNNAGINQIYIDRMLFFNCVREIGNNQPAGEFVCCGFHISNVISHNAAGAHVWIQSPTTTGNPSINIDHYFTAQARAGGTDPEFNISTSDNVTLNCIEVLGSVRNTPIFNLSSIGCGSMRACKSEAATVNSVSSGPLNNFFINTSTCTMTLDFNFAGMTLNDTGGQYKPAIIASSSTCNLTITSATIEVASGTGTIYLAAGNGNVTWINQPTIYGLGTGPAVVGVTNTSLGGTASTGIEFATTPGGAMNPSMGDNSSTWYGITTALGTAGCGIEVWNTPLTANRTKTLPSTYLNGTNTLWEGATTRTVRTAAATGASTLTVGTGTYQQVLSPGQWVDHTWSYASGWLITATGST